MFKDSVHLRRIIERRASADDTLHTPPLSSPSSLRQ
jgi:hypothetical protein